MAEILQSITQHFHMWQSVGAETELVLDSYGDVSRANIYFDNRLRSEPWKQATLQERKAALVEATELIDALNFAGTKAKDDQLHQFPRGSDTVVPRDVEKATYEIALKLLDGWDPDMEVHNLAAESQGFSTVRSTYNRTFALDYLRAGVLSSKAWDLLRPYLADHRTIKISRVN